MVSVELNIDGRKVFCSDEGIGFGCTWDDTLPLFFGSLKAMGYSFLFDPEEALACAQDEAVHEKYGENVNKIRKGFYETDQ